MSDEIGRVRLNLRVDEEVKRAFNSEIKTKFGKCRPYAGIELEREFRYFLGEGEFSELKDAVDDLSDDFDGAEGEEKIREMNRGETTVASHRIAEDVRTELMSAAKDDYRSPGELVEAIMYGYVTRGSVVERLTQQLQRISEQIQLDVDNSMGAKERRTKTIARELAQSGGNGFTLEEFDEAIEAARGISASDYTREQYLPRVLDELNYTWHPAATNLFVDRDTVDFPEVRDPTAKPLILMDGEDRRLAIKLTAYRKARKNGRGRAVFSSTEAVDVFQGRVRKSTVRPLMREIGDSSPGYHFDDEETTLKVNRKEIERHAEQNRDVLKIEQSTQRR